MTELLVRRRALLPDEVRVQRCLRAPDIGPAVLFFSGGNALRPLCRTLKTYTHNSVHLITPFDSGGSSARLRDAFDMLSVGDLRNRLMALADESARGDPAVYELFSHRLDTDAAPAELWATIDQLVDGEHPLILDVPFPLRRIVRTHLRVFREHVPDSFDPRGASLGNLVLAGGYLLNEHEMDSVIFLFSKLVEARGYVRPVVADGLHLKAELEDGTVLVGQHLITGKEVAPIASPVKSLELVRSLDDPAPVRCQAPRHVKTRIKGADVIVFPMGSFYTSMLATLLPVGVGETIAAAECPKVYVPSSGTDPEALGLSLSGAVERLLGALRADAGDVPTERLLHGVLLDEQDDRYAMEMDTEAVRALGVPVARLPIGATRDARLDPQRLSEALVSLA